MEDSRNQYYGEFDEYLQQTEPVRREKAAAWGIAIGLQAVDGLKPSAYLLETAKRHIEGDISIDEVKGLIDSDKHPTSTRQAPDKLSLSVMLLRSVQSSMSSASVSCQSVKYWTRYL